MLAQPVKASSVTHLTDARYFSAWEVDYIGFDFGPQGISATELAAMVEWIQGPQLIAELDAGWPMRLELDANTTDDLATLTVDGFQVDSIFGPENVLQYLKHLQRPIFLEVVVEGYADLTTIEDTLEEYRELVDHVVLNFKKGGIQWQDLKAGQPFSIEALSTLAASNNIWLEIDGALPKVMATTLPQLKGFSVRGGSEEKVGLKDFDDLADFFEDLEVEG